MDHNEEDKKFDVSEQSVELKYLKEQAAALKIKYKATQAQFTELKKKSDELLGKEPDQGLPE